MPESGGGGERTVLETSKGSVVSRPLKTGRSFVLVLPKRQVIRLKWDKALYDPEEEAQLVLEGKNLGQHPLEIRVEQQEQSGSWAPSGSLRPDVEAAHFETDKAFPLPGALSTLEAIAAFANQEASRLLLVVGHTDAVGGEDANLALSDERADAVSAYLRDDADAWMKFYQHSDRGKRWGTREDEHMLGALPPGGTPYYALAPSGKLNADLEKAFRAFQLAQGITETGNADRTRAARWWSNT